MALGVPAGATMPCHATACTPGTPASTNVGASGNIAERFGAVVASTLRRPLRMCAMAGVRSVTINLKRPLSKSGIASWLPL